MHQGRRTGEVHSQDPQCVLAPKTQGSQQLSHILPSQCLVVDAALSTDPERMHRASV